MQRLFVIILNYKKYGDTETCLHSLIKSHLPTNTSIIIVDNSQDKEKQDALLQKFPTITLLRNHKNLGFAAGNNRGITYGIEQHASAILLLNPDTLVATNFVQPLIHTLQSKKSIGIVATALKHKQKNIFMIGMEGSIDWNTAMPRHVNVKKISSNNIRTAEFVSFAAVLIKADVFKKVGLLDEHYFMYLEDVDYCLKVRNYGFSIVLNPTVVVQHHTSSSFKKPTDKLFLSFQSHVYFIKKWIAFPKNMVPLLFTILFYPYLYILWTVQALRHR